jgi:UDP-N-acetylglucosamine acyltransferase
MSQNKIHPTAIIASAAEIGNNVEIGAYSIIGPKVKMGDGCVIGPHVVIEGRTTLGPRNLVSSFASLGSRPQDLKYKNEDTELVIGSDNMFREYCNFSLGTVTGTSKTIIGNSNLFMVYTHVAHDCEIGNHVIVANGVAIAGHVEIGDGAVLGGLCAIHQFCRIGKYSMTAGGAMVAQDVIPYGMVHGDRARINGLNVVGLRRLGVKSEELKAIKEMYHIVFDSQTPLQDAVSQIESQIPESVFRAEWIAFLKRGERGICR